MMGIKALSLRQVIAAVVLTLVSANAGAHAIWIEPVAGASHVCFGEYGDNLREKTGGTLDKVTALEVSTLAEKGGDKLGFIRQVDHLQLTQENQPMTDRQAVVVQALAFKVRDSKDPKIGMLKPMQYARFAVADAEPASKLALDIQPVGKNTYRLNFHGKPLAKVALVVTAPNQWQREFKTNDAGEISFEQPWDGLYVIETAHLEAVKGQFEGDQYDAIRHTSSLSIKK